MQGTGDYTETRSCSTVSQSRVQKSSKSEQTYTAGFFFLVKLLPNKTVIAFVCTLALILVFTIFFFASFDHIHKNTLPPTDHFNPLHIPRPWNSSIILHVHLIPIPEVFLGTEKTRNSAVYDFSIIFTIFTCNIFF